MTAKKYRPLPKHLVVFFFLIFDKFECSRIYQVFINNYLLHSGFLIADILVILCGATGRISSRIGSRILIKFKLLDIFCRQPKRTLHSTRIHSVSNDDSTVLSSASKQVSSSYFLAQLLNFRKWKLRKINSIMPCVHKMVKHMLNLAAVDARFLAFVCPFFSH